MSHVSGVVLTCSVCEAEDDDALPPQVDAINAWLLNDGHQAQPLRDMAEHSGGHKAPQIFMLGGGFNYLDETAFAAVVMSQRWNYPANVVLIINPETGPAKVWCLEGAYA